MSGQEVDRGGQGGCGVEDEGEEDAEGATAEQGRGEEHEPVVGEPGSPRSTTAILMGFSLELLGFLLELFMGLLLLKATMPTQDSEGWCALGIRRALGLQNP